MRYLFFTNTPAHVHLYKYPVAALLDRGHEVRVLARDYGCTTALLDYYDLPYEVYGRADTTKGSLFRQLPRHYVSIFRRAWRYDPDVIFGIGGYAAHAGAVTRTPTVLVMDSEPTSLDHAVSRPFAWAILTPRAFGKDLGRKHYEFAGFKESAYLHPDVFEPSPVRDDLGVGPDEPFVVLRFNAFGSHHDVRHSGIGPDERRTLVDRLSEHATVFVSDEAGRESWDGVDARPFDLHPGRLHDVLAEASLLVADTQTMVTEAALLGTPAIRSNSFVGEDDMGNFLELERHGLVYNVPAFEAVLERAEELLDDPSVPERWARRRDEFVADTVNLSEIIVDVATNGGAVEQVPALQQRASRPHPHATYTNA
ncbi:hypothetical protein ACFQH6_08195 [Halobacteriaceae archaeon GCM10025711]